MLFFVCVYRFVFMCMFVHTHVTHYEPVHVAPVWGGVSIRRILMVCACIYEHIYIYILPNKSWGLWKVLVYICIHMNTHTHATIILEQWWSVCVFIYIYIFCLTKSWCVQ